MDKAAFFQLSYGLYIVSSHIDGKDAGCVINTLQQVTSSPAKLSIAINKHNFTREVIEASGVFAASVLLEGTDMNLIRKFGFRSSRDHDKFAEFDCVRDGNGVPYLSAQVAARFACRVEDRLDVGSHVIYVGSVTEAERIDEGAVMTYAYYHTVKNGITPPNAPSYTGGR